MKYTRKNKNTNKKRNKKQTNKKRNKKQTRNNKKMSGGGCGCNKMNGGSSGPSNFSELSTSKYYQYNNMDTHPNNSIISTSVPSSIVHGGSKSKSKSTKKRYNQTGGISAVDMVSSVSSPSSLVNYLTGSNYTQYPSYMQNNLSVHQNQNSTLPSTYLV
jgi:hypothetical protein